MDCIRTRLGQRPAQGVHRGPRASPLAPKTAPPPPASRAKPEPYPLATAPQPVPHAALAGGPTPPRPCAWSAPLGNGRPAVGAPPVAPGNGAVAAAQVAPLASRGGTPPPPAQVQQHATSAQLGTPALGRGRPASQLGAPPAPTGSGRALAPTRATTAPLERGGRALAVQRALQAFFKTNSESLPAKTAQAGKAALRQGRRPFQRAEIAQLESTPVKPVFRTLCFRGNHSAVTA